MPILFTLHVQTRDVAFGDSANFICCANGSNIAVHWKIEETRSKYWTRSDCSDRAFCVNNMHEVNSVCSILEVNTTRLNRRGIIVCCVVEYTWSDHELRNISTGHLTVRDVACKLCSHVYPQYSYICTLTCIHHICVCTQPHTHLFSAAIKHNFMSVMGSKVTTNKYGIHVQVNDSNSSQ